MDNTRTVITKSAEETKACGQELAASLMGERNGKKPRVVCLYGELGSGKTTFVQGVVRGLGVSSRLLSPTFIIVRRYQLLQRNYLFYHIDLYRIQTNADMNGLGLREIFSDPSAIIFIEWAERLGTLLPKHRTDITFDVIGEKERKICIKTINN